MEEIIRKRVGLKRRVIEKVRNWAYNLKFKSTVILIGSYARGDFNLWSDIDILLIAETNKPVLERLSEIDYPAGFEIIFIKPSEFKIQLRKREKYVLEAIKKGIFIRDDFKIKEYKKYLQD